MRTLAAHSRPETGGSEKHRRRANVLGVLLSALGWALGLASVVVDGPAGLLLPLTVGLAIAIRLADARPLWLRAAFWSGIAMSCTVAAGGLAALLLLTLSPQPQVAAPVVPPGATIVSEHSDPGFGGAAQHGVRFVLPLDDDAVRAFYDDAHRSVGGWTVQPGLNAGDWCWMRASDVDEGEATVLTRAPDVDGFAVTRLRLGPEFFGLPAHPTPADCAMLVDSVAAR